MTRRNFSILLCAVLWCCTPVQAHTEQTKSAYVPTLTFDVASIRESPPVQSYGVSMRNPLHSSEYSATNFTLINLVCNAFSLESYQVVALPDWGMTARFNIQAKSDSTADERLVHLSQEDAYSEKQHMLLLLLVDRLRMSYHFETREIPAFTLTVQKGGPKFHEGKPLPPEPDKPSMPNFFQKGDGIRGYEFISQGAPIEHLVKSLAGQMHKTIVDHTGLTGLYEYTLQYSGTEETARHNDPEVWPPLPRAIQEQLGLKFEPTKAPTRMLIIDHIEKPSAN